MIHDKAKLRAKRRKILESNGFLNGYFQPIPINTTVKDMLKINDYEEKRNLVAAIEKVSSTEQGMNQLVNRFPGNTHFLFP